MSEAIKVESLSKDFNLPREKVNSIKQLLINPNNWFGKKFTKQHALKNITFDVEKGEFFGVVGRNGSGKSSLLKILAGIYQPSKGRVEVNGKVMPFIELGVGFNPELTGRENVSLSGALLGLSEKEVRQRYKSIVEFAELEDFMDQKLKNYSSGMQVRLAFSIVIQAQADILLIDEVLAVGDSAFQQKCFDYFKKLKKQNMTVVFVSHDMDAIREYCDKAVLIENSKIVKKGTANEIAREYGLLFQDEDDSSDDEESGERHGNFDLKYAKPKHKNMYTQDDKTILIKTKLTANKRVESPNLGIAIKDSSGRYVCGTNTKLIGKRIAEVVPGKPIEIEWTVPNIFSPGTYMIDVAAVDMTESKKYDWWESASRFTIKKLHRTPYVVQPDINVKVKVSS